MKLNTAPVFVHFPAKGKPKAADTLDIQRVGFGAEAIARWIHERTDIQVIINLFFVLLSFTEFLDSRFTPPKLFRNLIAGAFSHVYWRFLVHPQKQFGVFVQQDHMGCLGFVLLFCHDFGTNVEPY